MRAIIPVFRPESGHPLYLQLYDCIRSEITEGHAVPGEKLPSLRNLSSSLGISLTTVQQAYNQLLVEGYIESRPHSGYFISSLDAAGAASGTAPSYPVREDSLGKDAEGFSADLPGTDHEFIYDLSCFDFVKWKKCINKVINEHPQMLLSESSAKGEKALRNQISKYVYRARGVRCTPDQIVTAAGTQQVISLLTNILRHIGISNIAVEDPGYLPARSIFKERGMSLTSIPVKENGIEIEKLPENIRCAAYVNPSNQFPTGAVIPAGRRYKLLEWADRNNSYIIEDDYDSELRYFGRPIPAMQGLDKRGRVIYLGSFSSTVFAAIKISYVILPPPLARVFGRISANYSQTCSKLDQLTLALFMDLGYYQSGIRKMRRLYAKKLRKTENFFKKTKDINIQKGESGLNMLISVSTGKPAEKLCQEAASIGIRTAPVSTYSEKSDARSLIFYYNALPLDEIDIVLSKLMKIWGVS